MTDPLITIGMPVYNGAAYVAGAIQSLLDQTEPSFLLLISDDCSDDETPAICERFAAGDTRIRFVRQTRHIGMTRNFNFVLDQAQSPFFMWAAQDDLWAPEFLEVALALLARDPSAIGATAAIDLTTGDGQYLRTEAVPGRMSNDDPVIRARSAADRGYHAMYALFRRERLVATGIRKSEVPAPDLAFAFGVALHGRVLASERHLSTQRQIGYDPVLGPDGRVVWEKALGPDGRLYAWGWSRTDLCRAMLRQTYRAPIPVLGKLRLSAHVAGLFVSFIREDLAFQSGRAPVLAAWDRRRYMRATSLALVGAALRPRKALTEARSRLAAVLRRT